MILGTISVILATILMSAELFAVEIFGKGKLSITGTIQSTYDDNILRYSDKDYNNAKNGLESQERQSPVETLDDLRTDLKISAAYRVKIFGKRTTRIQSTVNFARYLVNPINSFNWISILYKQNLSGRWNLSANYFYEPYYFLRDYKDVHTGEYHHADFALSKTTGKLYYRPVKLIEFIGLTEYKSYFYNEYFTEYDGTLVGFGGEGIIRRGPWRIALGYEYVEFNNTGFDASVNFTPDQDSQDTETGNGNYEEDRYSFSAIYSMKVISRKGKFKFNISGNRRCYTTDQTPAEDPIHHARLDLLYVLKLAFSLQLSDRVSAELGASHTNRDSEGSNPLITRVKTYSRNLSWVEFSYDF